MTKKFKVEVAFTSKEMGSQVHYLTSLHFLKHAFYAN